MRLAFPALEFLQKHEFYVSQGSIDALIIYLLREVENIYSTLWQIYSELAYMYKILSESAGFSRRRDFGVFSGSQFQLPFTYKTRTLSLTR